MKSMESNKKLVNMSDIRVENIVYKQFVCKYILLGRLKRTNKHKNNPWIVYNIKRSCQLANKSYYKQYCKVYGND
jgi:CRISPR/Cas system-associated protein endoribonuclease Cas2